MRTQSAFVLFFVSLFCLLSQVTFADTLQLTGLGGANADGVYTYPYYFTVTGSGHTSTNVSLSCLNFNREITVNESWAVNSYTLSSIPASALGSFTLNQFRADDLLYHQYAGANATLTSELQFAIWSVMDPADINAGNNSYNGPGAFDATAQSLAAAAISNAGSAAASTFANARFFLPDQTNPAGWTEGTPQIFMVDPGPSAVTPEPSTLMLLGTGLLGAVVAMRRKLINA